MVTFKTSVIFVCEKFSVLDFYSFFFCGKILFKCLDVSVLIGLSPFFLGDGWIASILLTTFCH